MQKTEDGELRIEMKEWETEGIDVLFTKGEGTEIIADSSYVENASDLKIPVVSSEVDDTSILPS